MKHSPNIGLSEAQNTIELRHKINSFKYHIQSLEKVYSKKPRCSSAYQSGIDSRIVCPSINHNESSNYAQTTQSNLFNKYEKQNLNRITKDNVLLLSKLMKTDQGPSNYHDKAFYSTFNQFKNNFMVSKFHDRKRSLSQITKQNNKLNRKIIRCASSGKVSACNQWKKDWGKNIKNHSENLSKKFPKLSYDYRALAQKELKNESKTFNRLKLRL